VGTLVAGAMLLGWRIPGGNGVGGLDLTIVVNPTGELQITPAGPVFIANGMIPGTAHGAEGSFAVRNRTGKTLDIRLRALPSGFEIDGALQVAIEGGGIQLFSGSLRELRTWTNAVLTVSSGASQPVTVRAWLPAGATAYQGWNENVSVEFQSTPVGG
jgi:hypothetical protein